MIKGSPSVEIINCEFNDIPDIARIHVMSWKDTYRGLVPQDYLDGLSIEVRKKGWESIFRDETNEDSNVFMAYVDNVPAGFVSFGQARDENMKGKGEIYAIYLLKEFWSKGIGFSLFERASKTLLKEGFSECYLWVLDTNKNAIDSYSRWGGTLDGALSKNENIGSQPIREIVVRFSLV
jgi:GNAT superfamily N-acetyltransferase